MTYRCVLVLIVIAFGAGAARADGTVDFNRDILPILSDKCFACHGPDAKVRKAGFRLDRKEAPSRRCATAATPLCQASATPASWSAASPAKTGPR